MAVTEAARTEVLCVQAAAAADASGGTVAAGRAAQELGLKRGEFELAVHLGFVRTTAELAGGRPRAEHGEMSPSLLNRIGCSGGSSQCCRDRARRARCTDP
ncbi:DUF6397 family protein [Streptomyces sp. LN500]|uniref:DUF6397 family protein n=1 Tax=Streptomyces sp. LN500 TaxID=3112978 RepID=UPI0037105E1A